MHGLSSTQTDAVNLSMPSSVGAAATRTDYAVAFGTVLACRLLASLACHIYDDAFITFRIAENFAQGRGFLYNPGAPWEPVLGTTTPVYACLMAMATLAGLKLTAFAVFFNACCDAATVVLLIRCLAGELSRGGWIVVMAFACLPELNRTAAGGMESSLFVTLVLLALCLGLSNRLIPAGIVSAILVAVRPEGLLLLPVLLFCSAQCLRQACRLVLPISLGLLVYVSILTFYFGSPISHSVLAKATLYGGLGGWQRVGGIIAGAFAPSWPLVAVLPLTIFGCLCCLRDGGVKRAYSVFVLLLTAAYLAARPLMFNWYYPPMLTADCLWIGIGLARLGELVWPSVTRRVILYWRHLFMVTSTAVVVLVAAAAYRLGPSPVRTRIYEPIQKWAAGHVAPDTTILACDIGWIGYASGARILDSGGLVWPEARRQPRESTLLREHQPDYALIIASPARIKVMQTDPDLVRLYRPVLRLNAGNDDRLVLPESSLTQAAARQWAANWRHDYVLYQRRDLLDQLADGGQGAPRR